MNEQGLALSRLWGRDSAARRGPKPKLTLADVVAAARRIARSDGLSAVTMAHLAESVGCSKMALYRHVTDRDDLLSAMLDAAIGAPPALPVDWRSQFLVLWDALLDIYAADPWLLELPDDLDGITPNNMAWIDTALGLLALSRLPVEERLEMVFFMTENIRFEARRRNAARQGNDLDLLLTSSAEVGAALPRERFPHLSALGRDRAQSSQRKEAASDRVRDLLMNALAEYFPDARPQRAREPQAR